MAPGFSPLDQELGRLDGALTPALQEDLALLGAKLPFAEAAQCLWHFRGTRVAESTVRRITEAAGAALVQAETAAVARLERELPATPAGPLRQQVSVDGAMAPVVDGKWREVRTLAVGALGPGSAAGEPVHARELSYFSRMADAATFTRLATGELHRRGTDGATTVVGVVDGASWCQGFLDHHTPRAVRILDFPHALQHLSAAAQAVFGPGSAQASEWLGTQAHTLRHGDPAAVLTALADLPVAQASDPATARAARDAEVTYCTTRIGQMRYRDFVELGYPIGSGAVESANKLVVEARLKGAGMHWALAHVDPMLALRGAICSDRWDEAWSALSPYRRRPNRHRRPSPPDSRPASPALVAPAQPVVEPIAPAVPPTPRPKLIVNGRPTRDHHWNAGYAYRHPADPAIPKL